MKIQFVMMAIFYDSVIRLIDNIPLFMSYLSKEPGVKVCNCSLEYQL